MKLIVAGANGFVGREVVRLALHMAEFTSVIALSRTPTKLEEGDEGSHKLRNVTVTDYEFHDANVKEQLAGASACIWTVAITPTRSKDIDFAEVKRVCLDATLSGLDAMYKAGSVAPFRFIYISGVAAERDQTKTPQFMPEYSLMRGETENRVLAYAAAHPGHVEACVAKPALIYAPWKPLDRPEIAAAIGSIDVSDFAFAMLKQVIEGIEMEPIMNDDLKKIGQEYRKQREEL